MGYGPQHADPIDQLFELLRDFRLRLDELERPTGSQTYNAVQRLTQLITGQSVAITTGSVTTGTLSTSSTASIGGMLTAPVGVRSVGVYNTLLTYGGPYSSQYVHQDGTMGYVPSSRRFKQDIQPHSIPLEVLRQLRVVQFRYIAAVENLGEDAAVEVGMIAEEVHDLGISWLVDYGADGEPVGLKRELFGLLALIWVQHLDSVQP